MKTVSAVASAPAILSLPGVAAKSLMQFMYTLYLFNKTDIATTVLPMLTFGYALAGPRSVAAFFRGFLWMELHLIAFEASRAAFFLGLEEDRISKPFRPIVSGRISLEAAHRLHVTLVILSLIMSAIYGGLTPSIIHLIAISSYNQGGLARFWALKSPVGALGYTCLCWGVTLMFEDGHALSPTARLAFLLQFSIFSTTGHTQDFRDRAGDAAIGRKTLAIVLSQPLARWSLLCMLFSWSTALVYIWQPPAYVVPFYYALAARTAYHLTTDGSHAGDEASYFWYNLWFSACQLLPVFVRI
ncbi:UbiA prenyltransferase family-domain-containing protein [Schizophyllum commune]